LAEKEPKERRRAGLIVTLLMGKVGINLVVAPKEKKGQNTLHADPLLEHAKKKEEVKAGAKKVKSLSILNLTIKTGDKGIKL
tara:strand:+ start:46 stop:291 length:246 start_codon:yes stop_codon:yes gene_type:complete